MLKPDSKHRVLLFPIHATSWPTMEKLAVALKEQGEFEPVVLLTAKIADKKQICRQHHVCCEVLGVLEPAAHFTESTDVEGVDKKQDHTSPVRTSKMFVARVFKYSYETLKDFFIFIEKKTNKRVYSLTLYHLLKCCIEVIYYKLYYKKIDDLLGRINPQAVFVSQDASGGVLACFIRECQKRKIKIIVANVAYQHADMPAKTRSAMGSLCLKNPVSAPWINYIIYLFLPNQFYRYNNRRTMFYQAYEVLALKLFGALPPFPWVVGHNHSDIVCVENHYLKDRLISKGVNPAKVVVTGHVDVDEIWQQKSRISREEFFKSYGFDLNKKLFVVALPQLIEHGYVTSWEETYTEIEYLVRICSDTGMNVLLALHPKMDVKNYIFLENKYHCKINKSPKTSHALPYADLFASNGSSTAFWAHVCGAVVINFDFYGFSLESFGYLKSFITVYSKPEFEKTMHSLTHDPEYFLRSLTTTQEEVPRFSLPLDGKNTERCLALLG
ncbi:MAG: hypothetical protein HQM16_01520 [Deltaproteobacteria bacterium]|nr:hypothetical protein [Deltaproteobacteria bacterium]